MRKFNKCPKCHERKPRAEFTNERGYQRSVCNSCRARAANDAPAEPSQPIEQRDPGTELRPCSRCPRELPASEFIGEDGRVYRTCPVCRARVRAASKKHAQDQADALNRTASFTAGCPFETGRCRPSIGYGVPDALRAALVTPMDDMAARIVDARAFNGRWRTATPAAA